jgi:hypothetical protein
MKRSFLPALMFVFLAGCSSAQPSAEPAAAPPHREQARSFNEWESTFSPSDYLEAPETTLQKYAASQNRAASISKDSIVMQEETTQGFRIQLFSSSNIDEAVSAKTQGAETFSTDSVYIFFDAPVYKVRLGDFPDRFSAGRRLPEIIDKGYPDAWIVPDRIIQRKKIHIPHHP